MGSWGCEGEEAELSPPSHYHWTCEVTLFVNRVFADEIVTMRSHWIGLGLGPWLVSSQEGNLDPEMQGRRPGYRGGRNWGEAPQGPGNSEAAPERG